MTTSATLHSLPVVIGHRKSHRKLEVASSDSTDIFDKSDLSSKTEKLNCSS